MLTGGCYCGNVRYEISHKPLVMLNCHCRACQKVSGGAYTPVVVVARNAFKVTAGQIKTHITETIKGQAHKRGFCADCGSRITGADFADKPEIIAVTASSLDDPSIFKPAMDVFTSHAQAWDQLQPNLPKFSEYSK